MTAIAKRIVDRIAGWCGAREGRGQAARSRRCDQGRARRDQRGLSVRDLEPRAVAGRYRRQRSDPQCAAGAGAYPSHAAGKLCRPRRRRARLQRRHGAGPEAGAARAAHRADHRRWRLSFLLAGLGIRRRPAISNSDFDCGARQWRLASGQVVGTAGLSEGRRRRDRSVSIAAALRPAGRAARASPISAVRFGAHARIRQRAG